MSSDELLKKEEANWLSDPVLLDDNRNLPGWVDRILEVVFDVDLVDPLGMLKTPEMQARKKLFSRQFIVSLITAFNSFHEEKEQIFIQDPTKEDFEVNKKFQAYLDQEADDNFMKKFCTSVRKYFYANEEQREAYKKPMKSLLASVEVATRKPDIMDNAVKVALGSPSAVHFTEPVIEWFESHFDLAQNLTQLILLGLADVHVSPVNYSDVDSCRQWTDEFRWVERQLDYQVLFDYYESDPWPKEYFPVRETARKYMPEEPVAVPLLDSLRSMIIQANEELEQKTAEVKADEELNQAL